MKRREGPRGSRASATVPRQKAPGQPADQAALVAFIQAGTPVDDALYTDVGGGTVFTTPSGNVRCDALRGSGVCLIGEAPGWPSVGAQPCADGWVWSDRRLSLSEDEVARG